MHISHFFFIKPYCELWNTKMSQKLLTSSFTNFKHEKTSLSIIPQSLQALRKTETKILFQEKPADYFKMHMDWDYACAAISRQAGQEVRVYSEFYICWDIYPAYLQPVFLTLLHPACVLLLKQGRLCQTALIF